MTRTLALAVTAVAGFAFPATAAAITVENPGVHVLTGENTISIHAFTGPTEVVGLKCNNEWEVNINESGHVDVTWIEIAHHAGSTGWCSMANDCGDSGWEGQIEEGHPGTGWEYALHFTLCLTGTSIAEVDGISYPIECEISDDGDEVHCGGIHNGSDCAECDPAEEEAYLYSRQIAPGVFVEIFVEGELFIDEPLDLMHQ